ncbi:MAG: hypothetical protein ACK55O_08205, partial [Phycisphaerales bacterium]
RRYYATDWQGRVVSRVTAAGEQAESYRYTANGVPIGIPLGDVNGDGKVEVGANDEDWQQAYWWENNFGPYEARLDLNLDGSVNATDIGLVGSQTPGTMPTARAAAASGGPRRFASARVDREAVLGREAVAIRMLNATNMGAVCIVSKPTKESPKGPWTPFFLPKFEDLTKSPWETSADELKECWRQFLKLVEECMVKDFDPKDWKKFDKWRDCLLKAAKTARQCGIDIPTEVFDFVPSLAPQPPLDCFTQCQIGYYKAILLCLSKGRSFAKCAGLVQAERYACETCCGEYGDRLMLRDDAYFTCDERHFGQLSSPPWPPNTPYPEFWRRFITQ